MTIVWFRKDLRVEDNPALFNAIESGQPVTAVYLATPRTWGLHSMGSKQIKWLHHNLGPLEEALKALGIPLIYKECGTFDECQKVLLSVCKTLSSRQIYFNNEYEWDERQRDKSVCETLLSKGIESHTFHEQCIIPPYLIKTQKGQPYGVFTPFKKACLFHIQMNPVLLTPLPIPKKRQTFKSSPIKSDPHLALGDEVITLINPGYKASIERLEHFIEQHVTHYKETRDIPSIEGTSILSPYLALGILSVRQCLSALCHHFKNNFDEVLCDQGASIWVSELLWRDFYKMICFNHPHVSRGLPFKKETLKLKWDDNEAHFEAWKEGRTGVPIIDSAMRQLNTTGWMHNRLRMIVAMYFTKNLWQDWRKGEAYFASKLLDWDFASNNGGWQWCASTGTDAAPYFRIFNPVTQSERFDSNGDFIKRFCPELKNLDKKTIHNPFEKSEPAINYPRQRVDLKLSRKRAIEQFKALKTPM